MREFKKVSGERVVAALIDYVAMYIIGLIISIIPIAVVGFSGGVDSIFDMLIGNPEVTGDVVPEGMMYYTLITVYVGLIASVIYFVVIPWRWNGQTIGKKLMKLRAVNEYGENPTFFQHFIRAIQNWTVYYTALIGWVILVNYLMFSILSIASLLVYIVFIISFIMLLAREDGRGIHDMISGTWVIKDDDTVDRGFAEATAQMGDWVEVEDQEDDWDKKKDDDEDDDAWEF